MTRLKHDFGFDPDAPNDVSAVLYRMARAGRGTVLHLGGGVDGVAGALSTLADVKVTTVMSDRDSLESETTTGLDTFMADPEMPGWYSVLDGRTYDVVVIADLPERLRDPGTLLRDLREQRLLADDGQLLLSFANLTHEAVANELLIGDSTRLHWYTLGSMSRLLEASGFLVVETHRTHRPLAGRQTTSGDDEPQTYEYVLQAKASIAGTQLALLRRQLDDTAQRLADAEARGDGLSALLDEERAAFRVELGRGADELEQLQKKLSQVTDERAALRAETTRLQHRLADLQRDLAVTSQAKEAVDRRLATIGQSRSYRWSNGLAKSAHRLMAPLRSNRRRAQGRA